MSVLYDAAAHTRLPKHSKLTFWHKMIVLMIVVNAALLLGNTHASGSEMVMGVITMTVFISAVAFSCKAAYELSKRVRAEYELNPEYKKYMPFVRKEK